MNKFVRSSIVVLVLLTVAAWSKQASVRSPALTPEMVKVAQTLLDNELNDYPSTRFRSVKIVKHDDDTILCGELKTRDKLGGYTGWTPFYVYTDRNESREKLLGGVLRADTPSPLAAFMDEYGGASAHHTSAEDVVKNACAGKVLDRLDHSAALVFRPE